ncbi:MAG: undecaprenyl/decaprenyl-phosphate alpha-N-acetylglucosaminyl 1-phosphate transferase, partial [Bacteroidetes bacterium]|nr:undecaprenyl/decaprenyl-phosphate alpha-N-acetylglucosaminyl 1-phosphate transferase [Bacteroidota bacterium]
IGFLLGLFDDAYDTKPLIKLFAQILCGVILIFTNVYIRIFDSEILNYLITIIWVVGMMNSINMLDNMDAITTLVSISILSTIIISLFISGNFNNPDLFIMLGLLASLVGFLKFNWSPATIYMGDTGSQFLGAFLSAIGIIYFWNNNDNVSEMLAISKQIIVTVLVFSIPIIDTTTVVIKRLRKGKSPFIGGKDHTAHHISYLGFNDKQVALIFICISVITMILTIIAINFIQIWSYLYVCLYVAYLFLLFISLFYIANLNIQKN